MNATKDWIYSTNIYEVNLRQYTKEGTFNAFAQHLPRLKEMGVQTLWFMPITPISKKEMKGTMGSYYACSDYTSVNPEFGTLNDFKKLIDYAHKLEFKVIIDWVANHTGWDHVWTKEHPEWYEEDSAGEFKRSAGMDDIIELDYSKKEMRNAMIEAMKFWVRKCGIDGFRCDLAFWVELDFWQDAIPQLNELKPLFWLAEADSMQYPDYMQVFEAAYAWTWMHRTEDWYKEKLPLKELTKVLDNYDNIPGIKAWFTSNHDENSWNGSEYEKYGDAAKALAVHSCTWPGIPLIYSGQELPNKKRLKFFDKDVIEWKKHCELHEFYRTLLHLKHESPALNAKSDLFQLHTNCDSNVLTYLRKKDQHEVIVMLNLSDSNVRFTILDNWVGGKFREAFLHHENNVSASKSFEMKAWEYMVWVKESV
jgi:alpha-amylase